MFSFCFNPKPNFAFTASSLYYLFISIFWIKTIWITYLTSRQLNTYKMATDVPPELRTMIDADIYEAMRRQSIKRGLYLVAKEIYVCTLWTCIISLQWFPGLWSVAEIFCGYFAGDSDSSILVNLMFMFLDDFVLTAFGVPLIYYKEIIINADADADEDDDYDDDDDVCRSNNLPALIEQHIKVFLISQVIFIPVGAVAVTVISIGGKFLFIYLWGFFGIAWTILWMFSSSFTGTFFLEYETLQKCTLRKRIEKIARSMNFPLKEILIENGGCKSLHSQVYLTGTCEYNKIVLMKTLFLKKSKQSKLNLTDDEILAIVCHELAHWKMNHVKCYILIMHFMLLFQVALFGYMFHYDPLFEALGFHGSRPIMVGYLAVMELVLSPINSIMHFFFNLLSRKMEFQADDFAKRKGYGSPLKRALCKMQKSLMYFPVNDCLFSAWHFTHPTALQRLRKLYDERSKAN